MKYVDEKNKITITELKLMAEKMFGELVKAVMDIEKEIMVVDAGLHADEEKELLSTGSKQNDLWGINLYPDEEGEDFIEYDSMINLRPAWGNRSRGVDNEKVRNKIRSMVTKIIVR